MEKNFYVIINALDYLSFTMVVIALIKKYYLVICYIVIKEKKLDIF